MSLRDRAPVRREALFGGEGAVVVWDLLGRASAEPFTAVLWCALEPGGRVGPHVQEHFPEIVVGLDGDGEATVGGAVHPLMPGDVVYLPLGAVLSITNRSRDEPLSYLIVKARPGRSSSP
ncbi:MAG TPA: cupin domain-containing protein [Sandaracinaceae bacterium]